MKTYSNRSNAIRAAIRQGYSKDGIELHQDGHGRWSFQPADNALEAELTEIYGTATCPACGIGLDNGVLDYQNVLETKGRKVADTMTHEFECMACGHEFGPAAPKEPEPRKEGRTYTRTGKYSDAPSVQDSPVAFVWAYLVEHYPSLEDIPKPRTSVIQDLKDLGINRNTADTELQKYVNQLKESNDAAKR